MSKISYLKTTLFFRYCPCVKISECPLVKDGQVKNLNVNHPVRREWVTFFRDRICDKVEKTVMCCSEEEMRRVSFTH